MKKEMAGILPSTESTHTDIYNNNNINHILKEKETSPILNSKDGLRGESKSGFSKFPELNSSRNHKEVKNE